MWTVKDFTVSGQWSVVCDAGFLSLGSQEVPKIRLECVSWSEKKRIWPVIAFLSWKATTVCFILFLPSH